jgi:hypothetical protein
MVFAPVTGLLLGHQGKGAPFGLGENGCMVQGSPRFVLEKTLVKAVFWGSFFRT